MTTYRLSETLNNDLFLLIGRLHAGSEPRECGLIRKAAELYTLNHSLPQVKAASLELRRRKLQLTQEQFAALVCVHAQTVIGWEENNAPAWIGPLLDALEERRRDEERRDYLGINPEPES